MVSLLLGVDGDDAPPPLEPKRVDYGDLPYSQVCPRASWSGCRWIQKFDFTPIPNVVGGNGKCRQKYCEGGIGKSHKGMPLLQLCVTAW